MRRDSEMYKEELVHENHKVPLYEREYSYPIPRRRWGAGEGDFFRGSYDVI